MSMNREPLTVSAEKAAALIQDGMTVAMSGWAMAGYPKAVPEELVRRKRAGEGLRINLITGANTPWLDEKLGEEGLLARRAPLIASKTLSAQANQGTLRYVEQPMSKMPRLLQSGAFGRIDVAVVEALGFDERGHLIPTSAVGLTPHLLEAAQEIIVEVNAAQPAILGQLHDIYVPQGQPLPLRDPAQRIGERAIPLDKGKVRFIVETALPERMAPPAQASELNREVAHRLLDFLEGEYGAGGPLPPLQTGFGGLADAVAEAFQRGKFKDLAFFCGGVTEGLLELMASGKVRVLSTGGIGMSDRGAQILEQTPQLPRKLVLRNGDITNSPEVIGRLGLIALNTGIEVDIYGNVNASHIEGSRVVNGIGGGAGFAQNAGLSILLIPSTAKGKRISSIVPMVTHQDISEHDIDILVTEKGFADLRGLDDLERAERIIQNCACELYKDRLSAYLEKAKKECGGHHPQLPLEAFDWHRRLKEGPSLEEGKSGGD